ncbi:MAG: hypothetical protein AAGB04_29565 [Pseudomonadota bacterium]
MRVLLIACAVMFLAQPGFAKDARVIEIATVVLKQGVAPEAFAKVDQAVESEHVSQQPGFISRETALNGRTWLVIVHWRSVKDAKASMASFAKAPAAAKFISMIDATSMSMTRYNVTQ